MSDFSLLASYRELKARHEAAKSERDASRDRYHQLDAAEAHIEQERRELWAQIIREEQ